MIYRIHLLDGTYNTVVADQAFIDAHFPGAELLPEPEPAPVQASGAPQSVSRAQGKLALIGAGLWPAAIAFVDGITDPAQKAYAEVALYDTQEWRRDSPFLASAAAALDLTEEQLDTLFITAGGLQL